MTFPRKILIAGDADFCAGLMEQFLREPDFAPVEAGGFEAALEAVLREAPDILLLADDFPPLGAEALAAAAREGGYASAIVLLGNRVDNPPAATELRLPRPIKFSELLARLRAPPATSIVTLRSEPPRLSSVRERLTEKEAAILARLSKDKGAVVSRENLLRDVWGYNPSVTTRTLETHIHRLRRKIEPDPARPGLLVTEGGGYRLVPDDER